jgi:hypothetical protein
MPAITTSPQLRVIGSRSLAVLGAVGGLAVLLAVAHALPATGLGAAIRLAVAATIVLLLPGALILRAVRWPETIGVAVAASFLLSVAVALIALAAAFAVGGDLTFALAAGGAVTLVALLVSVIAAHPAQWGRRDLLAVAGIAVAVIPAAVVVWRLHIRPTGDDIFHLARVLKLEALPELSSLDVVGEFENGGLHPGYAVPLWHGIVAAIARIAGVDAETTLLHLGQVAAPLTAVLAYGVGRALFGSWAGGLAAFAAQFALWADDGRGAAPFRSISDPETAARGLFVPALLILVLAYMHHRSRWTLALIATGGLALAIVHTNYAPYLLFVFAGFLVADLLVNRAGWSVGRLLTAMAVIAVPAAAYIAWLWPVITDTVSQSPGAEIRSQDFFRFELELQGTSDSFRQAPGVITRGGGAIVAGLAAVPLAALAARRRWGAFGAGATLAILIVVLTPVFFTLLADVASLSQARRLIRFLPLAVPLAGAAMFFGRLRLAGIVLAGAAGTAFALAYPGEWTAPVDDSGPVWPVWFALVGGALGLALAAWKRPTPPAATRWAAVAAIAIAVPLCLPPFLRLERDEPDDYALTPGLIAELRRLPVGETVFAGPTVSYRIAAAAPLYIAAAPPGHVAQTRRNQPFARERDAGRFFSARTTLREREQILAKYGADWVVATRERRAALRLTPALRCVYADDRYVLWGPRGPNVPPALCP